MELLPVCQDMVLTVRSSIYPSTAVDTVREKFTILSPNPGKLPSRTALVGSFEWQEM